MSVTDYLMVAFYVSFCGGYAYNHIMNSKVSEGEPWIIKAIHFVIEFIFAPINLGYAVAYYVLDAEKPELTTTVTFRTEKLEQMEEFFNTIKEEDE